LDHEIKAWRKIRKLTWKSGKSQECLQRNTELLLKIIDKDEKTMYEPNDPKLLSEDLSSFQPITGIEVRITSNQLEHSKGKN